MISDFIKNFTFWFYFIVGITLNICQIAIYFESSHYIGKFIISLVAGGMLFSFWLTSVLAICYIIAKCIDEYKGVLYEKGIIK